MEGDITIGKASCVLQDLIFGKEAEEYINKLKEQGKIVDANILLYRVKERVEYELRNVWNSN